MIILLIGFGFSELLTLVIGAIVYFLPSYIGRHKENFAALFALNLLLGWTFVGWVIALVWALMKERQGD